MDFKYPYTDFHELNLDWFLSEFKKLTAEWLQVQQDWADEQQAYQDLHDYVENYFDNLDLYQEVHDILWSPEMQGNIQIILSNLTTNMLPGVVADQITAVVASQLSTVVALQLPAVVEAKLPAALPAAVAGEASAWLADHVDPATGYVIDDTLTIALAAADAKAAGDNDKINFMLTQVFTKTFDVSGGNIEANGFIDPSFRSFNNIYTPNLNSGTACLAPAKGYRVAVAYYNKADRTFVNRTTWSTDPVITDNDYLWRFTFASVDGVGTPDAPEDVLLNLMITFNAVEPVEAVTDYIAYTSPEMVRGWTTHPTEVMQSGLIRFHVGETLTPKPGYEIALTYDNDGTFAPWTDQSYTFTADPGYNLKVVVRYPNYSGSFIEEYAGLSDYITESYSTFNPANMGYFPTAKFTSKLLADIREDTDAAIGTAIDTAMRSKWHGKKTAFVGDSITEGIGTTPGHIYYEVLNNMISFASVYADGIAGSSFSSLAIGGYTPIVQRTGSIPVDSDLIVIFAGTNDFGHDTPLGVITDTTDVSFYGAVAKTIIDIVTAHPSARLVFLTPLHRTGNTYLAEDTPNNQGLVLLDYVNALKAVAAKYSIPVIDTYSIYGLNPVIPVVKTNYITDGLHPNNAGHQLLAERIIDYIEIL